MHAREDDTPIRDTDASASAIVASRCLSVEDLADRMSMSVRNFERVFTREVGTTPSQYVLQVRVEAARRQLERTNGSLKLVASVPGSAAPT